MAKMLCRNDSPDVAAGAEVAAEAEMNARENAVKDVAAQILPAEPDDLRAGCRAPVGKQGNDLLCRELQL